MCLLILTLIPGVFLKAVIFVILDVVMELKWNFVFVILLFWTLILIDFGSETGYRFHFLSKIFIEIWGFVYFCICSIFLSHLLRGFVGFCSCLVSGIGNIVLLQCCSVAFVSGVLLLH